MSLSVDAVLGRYRGARVYFNPLWGNNGDALITMGSRLALADARLELVRTERDADLIVVNGGGGLQDVWPHRVAQLAEYAVQHAHKPLVVLPQTVALAEPRALVEPLSHRAAPTTFFARDQQSHAVLLGTHPASELEVGLDHDMAFRLEHSDWLADLRRVSSSQHCLIVERMDSEGTTESRRRPLVPAFVHERLDEYVPGWLLNSVRARTTWPIKRALAGKRYRAQAEHTPFAERVRETVLRDDFGVLPVLACDISAVEFCPFDEFISLIVNAAAVATNRLHVAILAALLGKRTFVWPGATFKIAAIYEYSLRRYAHVSLLDWTP